MSILKLITGTCLIFLAFFVLSIVFSVSLFTNPSSLSSALSSEEIRFAVLLTLSTSVISTLIALLIGIPAAYALSRSDFLGKSIVEALVNIPLALPPVALGTALLVFFTNTPVGAYIDNSLVSFVFEVPGVMLAQFAVVSVLSVRLMKPIFDNIDKRYVRIARTLGRTELQSFLTVTLPLAKKGIFAAGILTWTRALGEFGATVTLAGATRYRTETLPIAMFLSLAVGDVEKAMAVVLILLALTFPAFLVIRKALGAEYA